MNPNKTLTPAQIEQIKKALGQIKSTATMFAGKNLPHRATGIIETWCNRIGRDLLPQPAQTSDMRKAFERWMIHVRSASKSRTGLTRV